MLLLTTPEELDASPMDIAKDIAVMVIRMRDGFVTLELAYRPMAEAGTPQPAPIRRVRLHPENMHLFADMTAKMYVAAQEPPKAPPMQH